MKRKNGKIDKYFEGMMKRTHIGSVGWVDAAPALQNITKKTNIPTNSLYRRNDRVDVYPLLHPSHETEWEGNNLSISCSLSFLLFIFASCHTNAAPQNTIRSTSNQCRTVCNKVVVFAFTSSWGIRNWIKFTQVCIKLIFLSRLDIMCV